MNSFNQFSKISSPTTSTKAIKRKEANTYKNRGFLKLLTFKHTLKNLFALLLLSIVLATKQLLISLKSVNSNNLLFTKEAKSF
jgi:hypothetical protein